MAGMMNQNSDDRTHLRRPMDISSDQPITTESSISENTKDKLKSTKKWLGEWAHILFVILIFPLGPLDPHSFAVSSIFQMFLDPLFLYVPLINENIKCVMSDHKLKIAALVLRSYGDVRYVVKIILCIKKGWQESHSLKNIAITIAIDTVSVLPIPQVVILIFLPNMRGSSSLKIMKVLNSLIVLQYLTRIYPIFIFCKDINAENFLPASSRSVRKIPNRVEWNRILIAFNFLWYLLASHVLGAFWYFFSIQREISCWGHLGGNENGIEFSTSCDENTFKDVTLVDNSCPKFPPDETIFDFGIYLNALQSGMQESTNFPQKLIQCFSWGLRNLSSFASNLNTSAYGWENFFVVLISICGLLLFTYLLGHVQTFMQGTNRSDSLRRKMETNMRSLVSESGLCEKKMGPKVQRVVKAILEEDENPSAVNVFSILSSGRSKVEEAEDLAKEIKRNLFMMLKKVEALANKSEAVLTEICEHLEPLIYNEGCYIIREGEPLDMMFFITQGNVLTYATNNSRSNGSSSTNQLEKEKDGFYGEKLLTWAEGHSSELFNLPISPITVKAHTKVIVFALKAIMLQRILNKYPSHLNEILFSP